MIAPTAWQRVAWMGQSPYTTMLKTAGGSRLFALLVDAFLYVHVVLLAYAIGGTFEESNRAAYLSKPLPPMLKLKRAKW